jgi:hypothetical protein
MSSCIYQNAQLLCWEGTLLTKLRAQITFNQGGPISLTVRGPNALIMAVTMPTEDQWQLYHQEKWDLAKPICLLEEFPDICDLAGNHVPIVIDLKPGALPVRQSSIQNWRGDKLPAPSLS